MGMTFFLDESGHSGDAIHSGTAFDFEDQPYFALAAVGMVDEHAMNESVKELRAKHRAPAGELKSKSKWIQNNPGFVADLLSFSREAKLPIFVEVVDKRYFLCIHLVNSQLLPAILGFREDARLRFVKNCLADFLYDEVSDHVLNQFVTACLEPSDHALMSALGSQLLFSAGASPAEEAQSIRQGMHRMVLDTLESYAEMRKRDPHAYLKFLPEPDLNKRHKPVWMLPNLSSFANIYARINLFRRGKLADVQLIHDQQLEVEDILRSAKQTTELLKDTLFDITPTPFSDFVFEETATFTFTNSHESVGIQLADVVAGSVMRCYRDRLRGSGKISSQLEQAVRRLLAESDPITGCGINQVIPLRHAVLNIDGSVHSDG